MNEINAKIKKLEKEVMYGKRLAADPAQDFSLKIRKFTLKRDELIESNSKSIESLMARLSKIHQNFLEKSSWNV